MHTPTKQQWQTVIDNFEKVLPLATQQGHLDMDEYLVNTSWHKCGTVHCVGGWYAVAVLDTTGPEVDYNDGANALAAHLGFQDRYLLEQWAEQNPEIWGEYGKCMFYGVEAYGGAQTLAEVVDYLKGVRYRSPEQ